MKAYELYLQKTEYAQGGFAVMDINKDGIKELFVTDTLSVNDTKYHNYVGVKIFTYVKEKKKN